MPEPHACCSSVGGGASSSPPAGREAAGAPERELEARETERSEDFGVEEELVLLLEGRDLRVDGSDFDFEAPRPSVNCACWG